MKKRILSLLLAVCLCVALLPTVALAADVYGLSVCGKDTPAGINSLPGVQSTKENDTLTLTLTNATLNSSSGTGESMIKVDGMFGCSLVIDLVGQNTITVPAGIKYGIYSGQPVRIKSTSGDGSLTINYAAGTRTDSVGIYTIKNASQQPAGLTIDSGVTVTITAGDVSSSNFANSYGVNCAGDLTVNGELTATGGAAISNGDGYCTATSEGVLARGIVTVNGTLTGIGGSATNKSGAAISNGVDGYSINSMTVVYGSLTGIAGVAEGFTNATACGVTGESIIVSGEKAELNASCDVSGTGASATAKGEGSTSNSNGILMNRMLTIRDGAHVTAASGTAVATSTAEAPGVAQSNGISGNVEARLLVEGAGTVLHATGNAGTESIGIQATSADIRGGTVVCSGQKAGIWAGELNLGAQGQNVNFTASATGSDPWAALFLNNNGEVGSLTLTHAQVVQPAESKIGEEQISINGMSLNCQTILNADDKTAMQVHIVSGAADESLPGWLSPVIDAVNGGASGAFTDVKSGDWFYDAVRYVNEYGLMTGTADNCFSPNAPVTRGMVMTILARREGIKTNWYSPWYAAGVEWAKSVGISDGTNPEVPITREQLAVMLYRYAQYKGYDLNQLAELAFTDAAEISDYATIGLRWAVGSGIMSGAAGLESGKLLPQSTATRAQLATMLYRLFG